MKKTVHPYEKNGAPLWNYWCTPMKKMVHPYENFGAPLWKKQCTPMKKTVHPYEKNGAFIFPAMKKMEHLFSCYEKNGAYQQYKLFYLILH